MFYREARKAAKTLTLLMWCVHLCGWPNTSDVSRVALANHRKGQCVRAAGPAAGLMSLPVGALKLIVLIGLVIQTCFHSIIIKYSTAHPSSDGRKYVASTTVLLSEFVKIVVCIFVIAWQERSSMSKAVRVMIRTGWTMFIPAFLFAIQNNLSFVALRFLQPATFQVVYQSKIFTTAIMSVILLKKRLSKLQWVCLALLVQGVVLAQIPSNCPLSAAETNVAQQVMGSGVVIIMAIASGLR